MKKLLLVLLILTGAGYFVFFNVRTPVITSIEPNSGSVGEKVTIKGRGFAKSSSILVGKRSTQEEKMNTKIEVSGDGKTLTFEVSKLGGAYCPGWRDLCPGYLAEYRGTIDIAVANAKRYSGKKISNIVSFTIE